MPFQKHKPVRSKQLRDSARGEECTVRLPFVCNRDPATTILAHAPHGGRAMARKAGDDHAVYACSACHDYIDGRTQKIEGLPLLEVYECVIRALFETHERMREKGLVVWCGDGNG